jgi:hypothetical protein
MPRPFRSTDRLHDTPGGRPGRRRETWGIRQHDRADGTQDRIDQGPTIALRFDDGPFQHGQMLFAFWSNSRCKVPPAAVQFGRRVSLVLMTLTSCPKRSNTTRPFAYLYPFPAPAPQGVLRLVSQLTSFVRKAYQSATGWVSTISISSSTDFLRILASQSESSSFSAFLLSP